MAKNPRLEAVMNAAAKKAGAVLEPISTVPPVPTTTTPPTPTSNPPAPSATTTQATPPTSPPQSVPATSPVPSPSIEADYVPGFLVNPTPTPIPPPTAPLAIPPTETTTPGDKEINFANLRKKSEGLEQKLAQVFDSEGKVKSEFIKSLNLQVPEVAQLQKERDDALDLVAKLDLASDPRWLAKYAPLESAAVNAIAKFAKEYEVKLEDVSRAMKLSLKDRTKFFQENMPDAVGMIAPHLATLDNIAVQKESDLKNARQTAQTIESQTASQRERAIAEARQTIGLQVVRELGQAGLYVFNERPGNEEWNKGVAQVKQRFVDLLATNDVMAHSRAMALGVAAPVLFAHVKAQDKIIDDLRIQLKLHSGASATISTSGSSTSLTPLDLSKATPKEMAKMAVAALKKS